MPYSEIVTWALVSLGFLTMVNAGTPSNAEVKTFHLPYRPGGVDYTVHDLLKSGVFHETMTSIVFKTMGKNDCHILLKKNANDYTNGVIEIVIGGWGNSQSVIRAAQQGSHKATYRETGILSASEYRTFWISWTNDCIRVGKGDTVGENEFMQWCGLSHSINDMSIGYGYGSDGYFKFDVIPEVKTFHLPHRSGGVDYTVHDLLKSGVFHETMTSIVFKTMGKNDCHILLKKNANDYTNGVIEIVIGGWGNSQSVIRAAQQGSHKATYRETGILSASEYRTFWISWTNDCIRVGKGDTVGENEFMNWCGLSHSINDMSIGYGYGSDGYFQFDVIPEVKTFHLPHRSGGVDYTVHDLLKSGVFHETMTSIVFKTMGKNDCHILLKKNANDYTNGVIEIVIGGWGNSQSVIRAAQQGSHKATFRESGILSASEYRTFWISWTNDCIRVGKGDTVGENEFMQWCGLSHSINDMSIGYGYGSDGYFQFDVIPGLETYYLPYRGGGVDYTLHDLLKSGVFTETMTSIVFKTMGKNDCHILLKKDANDYTKDVIEIVIGGWGNSQSVIRTAQQGSHRDTYRGRLLSDKEYRTFWISWANKCIKVGKGATVGDDEFMNWCGLSHSINDMSIGYGYGSDGYFQFYDGYYDDMDGGLSSWSPYSKCTKSCGTGTQTRTRACDNPAPSGNGANCVGPYSDTIDCNIQACPVDGRWGYWSSYGACTKTCGTGTQTRTRACDNPAPSGGGAACDGPSTETQECNTQACSDPDETAPAGAVSSGSSLFTVDGRWGYWSSYGACTKTCGTGNQTRTRACDNPAPSGGGAACDGPSTETQNCNTQACSVDGRWGYWSSYGACTKTCGTGNQTRTRACDNPAPSGGGAACDGPSTETQNCNTQACSDDKIESLLRQCTPTSYFVVPNTQCRSFYQCQPLQGGGYSLKKQTCPGTLKFDIQIKVCNWPTLVTCKDPEYGA